MKKGQKIQPKQNIIILGDCIKMNHKHKKNITETLQSGYKFVYGSGKWATAF